MNRHRHPHRNQYGPFQIVPAMARKSHAQRGPPPWNPTSEYSGGYRVLDTNNDSDVVLVSEVRQHNWSKSDDYISNKLNVMGRVPPYTANSTSFAVVLLIGGLFLAITLGSTLAAILFCVKKNSVHIYKEEASTWSDDDPEESSSYEYRHLYVTDPLIDDQPTPAATSLRATTSGSSQHSTRRPLLLHNTALVNKHYGGPTRSKSMPMREHYLGATNATAQNTSPKAAGDTKGSQTNRAAGESTRLILKQPCLVRYADEESNAASTSHSGRTNVRLMPVPNDTGRFRSGGLFLNRWVLEVRQPRPLTQLRNALIGGKERTCSEIEETTFDASTVMENDALTSLPRTDSDCDPNLAGSQTTLSTCISMPDIAPIT